MRILLVTSRYPLPPWRGNQLRTVQWLDSLGGGDCLLLCPPCPGGEPTQPISVEHRFLPHNRLAMGRSLVGAVLRGRPAQEGLYASAAASRVVADAVSEWQPDVAIVQMVRCGWAGDAIRAAGVRVPLVFDAIDSMGLHYRRAAATARPFMRMVLQLEARRCRRREHELVSMAAATVAVARRDLEALHAGERGWVIPVVAGTVARRHGSPEGPPTVLLSGNLGYRPTVQSAQWFAHRVWPQLRKRVPEVRWLLVGARASSTVRRLGSLPGVEVHSDVADLAPYLCRASVAVAPMTSGSGVPIKILEAMAAGVPVVADPWSAAGLQDDRAVVVAGSEAAWVDALERLLTDTRSAAEQATRAGEVWRNDYEPDRVAERVREVVAAAASGTIE